MQEEAMEEEAMEEEAMEEEEAMGMGEADAT